MKKFNVGDIVTLQQYIKNGFKKEYYEGNYYIESKGIPPRLIIHGSLTFKDGKGEVIDYHDQYVIVKFTTANHEHVQLGFDEHDLILVEATESQFKFLM